MSANNKENKRLLLHTCCAPCSPYVIEHLQGKFDVTAFFYNPNIHPLKEYQLRLEEMKKLCTNIGIELIIGNYDVDRWFQIAKGMEREKEGGKRCELCFKMRLHQTACTAQKNDCQYLATTLTVSPHKNATVINQVGRELQNKHPITFYEADFKKHDGFKKSCELSKTYGFYRQNYCGCIYSKRN